MIVYEGKSDNIGCGMCCIKKGIEKPIEQVENAGNKRCSNDKRKMEGFKWQF